MNYQSYVCQCRLDGHSWYLIWQTDATTDGPDRVIVDRSGRIATFPSEVAARTFAAARGEPAAEEDPVTYDLDRVVAWCRHPDAMTVDCEVILDTWNLLLDLPRSPAEAENVFARAEAAAGDLYEKLFFGNNLPAVTPRGASYGPQWSADEITRLSEVLQLGLADLTGRLP